MLKMLIKKLATLLAKTKLKLTKHLNKLKLIL